MQWNKLSLSFLLFFPFLKTGENERMRIATTDNERMRRRERGKKWRKKLNHDTTEIVLDCMHHESNLTLS